MVFLLSTFQLPGPTIDVKGISLEITGVTGLQDRLNEELNDAQQASVFEKEAKEKATSQVEHLRAENAKLAAETQAAKAAGPVSNGDVDSLQRALEQQQAEVNKHLSRIEELEGVVARLTKERDLINKKMDRVQTQKEAETKALKAQLDASVGAVQTEVNERDRRINELMEELGNREVRPACQSVSKYTSKETYCARYKETYCVRKFLPCQQVSEESGFFFVSC